MTLRYIFILLFIFNSTLFSALTNEQKKITEELTLVISNYLYTLEYENIPLTINTLTANNKDIKAIEIKEDFENKTVYSYYHQNEKPFYNKTIPTYIKENYTKLSQSAKFNDMNVGTVIIYFSEIKELKLNKEEKNYLKNNQFNIYTNTWAPFSILDKKTNSHSGLAHEFWKNIKKNTQINYNIKHVELFGEMIEKIKNDENGILLSLSYTKDRENYALFSKPYVSYPIGIATNIKKSYLLDLNELKGKTLAVGKNFSAHKLLKKHYPDIKFVPVKNTDEALKLLSQEKVFAAADILPVLKYALEKNDYENIKISGTSKFKFDVRFMVNKQQSALIPILNKAIDAIDKNDRILINKKWNKQQVIVQKTNYTLVYILLASMAIIISFSIYRQYILKRSNIILNEKVEERTKDLKKLNETLEIKVQKQVEQLRNNDILISEQSKLAAMGEMIGNISHQWRQPLSVISTGASGLRLAKELNTLKDKEFYELCDAINDNAQHLSHTIDNFTRFIKSERKLEDHTIEKDIQQAINIINSTLEYHNINLEDHINYEELTIIKMIPGELSQVIINILSNAKDIILDRQIKNAWVKLNMIKENDKVIITLEDDGGGIPDEVLPHIFEPYYTTKHKAQGTGLGLHMSYKIITENYDGRLYAQNTQNGAKFFIEIPVNQ